jgi:ankyrin repeat protein
MVHLLVIGLGANVNQSSRDGLFPLFIAAMSGNLDMVRCLVNELGADVNQGRSGGGKLAGATSLMAAIYGGHLNVVRCLVKDLGADVYQAMNDGSLPVQGAAVMGHRDILRCLVEELGADATHALSFAAQEGRLDMVRYLVTLGVDVNKTGNEGCTPLYLAAQNGHFDVVQFLVKNLGADINKAMPDGRTALIAASNAKHDKIIRFLNKHGANSQASSVYGTAAQVSKECGAPAQQTEYLEAKAHCSNSGCGGAGLKKCTGCKQARYCGQACQLAHWKTHRVDCTARKES